jgi:cytochrome c oxidase subunit 3
MAHAVVEEPPIHMGLPVNNGKLALWLFLVTEIMFFTGLIGTYIILRNGQPAGDWPTPHQVHLIEWIGALNTFVLICSSLTVVLAHWSMGKGNVAQAVLYIAVTLALGGVFLVIKAVEYHAKWEHDILPGHVFDQKLDGPEGPKYMAHVAKQLKLVIEDPKAADVPEKKRAEFIEDCTALLTAIESNTLSVEAVRQRVQGSAASHHGGGSSEHSTAGPDEPLLKKYPDLPIKHIIPYGNLWASCYFAMTGFHALHVFGGLVVFVIILLMALVGRLGVQHTSMIELTGLYWHFVDIVWIFLFPLLYLI